MKVAVTATGQGLDAPMDSRFGRAECFVVYDSEQDRTETVDNAQNLAAVQGAGIQAAKTVATLGVEAVITGHVGPKAFAALSAAGVRIYTASGCTVGEAIDRWRAGDLSAADRADVDGHWV